MSRGHQGGISREIGSETEPLYCFPGGGTDPFQAQKEFMLAPLRRPGGIRPQDTSSSPLFYN